MKKPIILISLAIILVVALLVIGYRLLVQRDEPVVEEPLEVVVLDMFSGPAYRSGLQEGWWINILKEQVGVQVNILPKAEGDWALLLAGGEMPDLVLVGQVEVEEAARANLLVNLDDHLDKLPNAVENAPIAMQYFRDVASYGTGRLYAIPAFVGPGTLGVEPNWGPELRWDLYRKLGMPELETLEDYLPLLKQMQELEPYTEDGHKVYGISMFPDWGMVHSNTMGSFLGYSGDQLGALPFIEMDWETGETKSMFAPDSTFIRSLKFYFTANQMGLVDPDSLTQTFEIAREKAVQGRTLFSWWWWYAGEFNTEERVNADPPIGFRPILTNEHKTSLFGYNTVGRGASFAISAATEHLDAALRYVDFMFSVDGIMQMANGPRGVIWDVNEDGEPFITDAGWEILDYDKELPGGSTLHEGLWAVAAVGISYASIHPEFNVPIDHRFWPTTLRREPTKLMEDWSSVTGYLSTVEMLKGENRYFYVPLAVTFIPAMDEDISVLVGRISEVQNTYGWRMIFAEDEAEFYALYEEMVEKAEGHELQTVLDWNVQAWKIAQETAAKYE